MTVAGAHSARKLRCAKKAANKVHLAVDVLAKNYLEGQRWLVYCEDTAQMKEVQRAFRDAGIACTEYHTAMTGDPEETLRWFKVAGGVLVSIKCLDEGVDIPSADHALILSSSQNPRQFIQRRGRVLRKSEGKYLARIHDALVMPVCLDEEPDQMSLLKSEFLRAVEFARSAMNRTAVADLRSVATRLGIDPDELINDGYEEDL
jgi:superfamily II DNA or RNA helicase